jgi:hypothetical protein
MSAFGGLILTNKGRALQAKAQTGVQLNFTKVKVGDGSLSGQSILELNDLISPKKELSILELKTLPEDKASLKSFLSNSDITTGFYWRELGVFAQDPDEGEILYCYGNAGANAEYIPAGGGADVVEKHINIVTIVGNVSSVSATLGSEIYVTQADFDAHVNNVSNPHNVTVTQIGAETPAGAQSKADVAETNAKSYTDGLIDNLAGTGRTTETVKGNADNISAHINQTTEAHGGIIATSEKGQPNGVATLDANGQVPAIQIPDNVKEIKVVNTIADRDALLVYEGLRVHVIDATADPTVDSGWAEYLWTGAEWVKTAENESIDIVLDWANIQNKPSSFTPTAHKSTHATGGSDELTPADIGAETPAGAQTKVDAHANATAVHSATSAAIANRIMMRDSAGRAKVAAPAAADDIARKDTVDAVQTNLNNHTGNTSNPHNVTAAQLGASNILAQIKTVDGAGSGLDADTVDGLHHSSFTRARSGGQNIWVQSTAPTAIAVGDIWVDTSA